MEFATETQKRQVITMSKFKVLEYSTTVVMYKIEANDRGDAIKKIEMGDLGTRVWHSFGKEEIIRKWYEAEDLGLKWRLANGRAKAVQTIGKATQSKT